MAKKFDERGNPYASSWSQKILKNHYNIVIRKCKAIKNNQIDVNLN
jgi:hypothetical protein